MSAIKNIRQLRNAQGQRAGQLVVTTSAVLAPGLKSRNAVTLATPAGALHMTPTAALRMCRALILSAVRAAWLNLRGVAA